MRLNYGVSAPLADFEVKGITSLATVDADPQCRAMAFAQDKVGYFISLMP